MNDEKLLELIGNHEKHGFRKAIFEIIRIMNRKKDGKIELSDINHLIELP